MLSVAIPLGSLRSLSADTTPAITGITPAYGAISGGNQVSIATSNVPAGSLVDVASSAKGGTATANSSSGANTPNLAIDSNDSTNWVGPGGTNYYVQSTFSQAYSIQQVSWNKCGSDTTPRQAKIQLLQSGTWVDAVTFTDATTTNTGSQSLSTPVTATAVRMYFTSAGGWVVCSSLSAYSSSYTVMFDSTPATNVSYPSATEILATAPAHTAGTVPVSIASNGTTVASMANAYEYVAAPTVTTATPSSGLVSGGDSVTISGTGFKTGAQVRFGTINAINATVINSTTMTATTPANSAGPVTVEVSNADGQKGTLANGFTYNISPPNLQTISPNKGAVSGGTSVTLNGTNFVAPNSTTNTWTSAGKTLPASFGRSQTAVIGDKVYLFGGLSGGTFLNTIYSAPVSDPTTWTNTGKTLPATRSDSQLAVIGDKVWLFGGDGAGGGAIWSAPVSDPTTWTATGKSLPVATRLSQLAVIGDKVYLFGGYTTAGTSAILSASTSDPTTWTNTGKALPGALYSSALSIVNDKVYLFGGSSNVIYSAMLSDPITWTNTTKTLPTAVSDSMVSVIGDNIYLYGNGTLIQTASVSSPTAWSVSPKTLPTSLSASSLAIINNTMYMFGGLSGGSGIYTNPVNSNRPNQFNKPWTTNWLTNSAADQSAVLFGGTPATTFAYAGSTQMTATTPAHTSGTADVVVRNYDGQTSTLANSYSYLGSVALTAAIPNQGSSNGGDTVTISGSNFTAQTAVSFGGTAATQVDYVNSTTLNVTTPAHAVGTVNIVVSDPVSGSATLTNGFTYVRPAPTVTSYTPAAGTMNGGNTVVFQGSGFTSNMVAYFDGAAATTTGSTASSLTVIVPASAPKDATITIASSDSYTATLQTKYRYTPQSYNFTNTALQLRATQPGQLTIESRNASNQPVTAPYDTDLQLTSTSTSASFSTDGGNTWSASTVRLPAGQSSINVSYKDAQKGTPTITATGPGNLSTQQNATIAAKYSLLVVGVSDPIKSGVPSSVTVQAVDYLGNTSEDYHGTVRFSSSDQYASLPDDYTLSTDAKGRHTFINGVSMVTSGEQCVTITDITDSDIQGQQCNISVTEGYTGTASKLAIITDAQSMGNNKPSSAITIQSQDDQGSPQPVPVDTPVYITSSSGTGSYSKDGSSGWSSSATFSVIMKAHTTSATVYYRDSADGDPTLSFRDQASGSDVRLTDTSQTEHVGVGPAAAFAINAPALMPTNAWQPISVRLVDQDGRTATNLSDNQTVYLSSDASSVRYSTHADGSGSSTALAATIPSGANHVTVYALDTTAGSPHLTASDALPADGANGLGDTTLQANFADISSTPSKLSITSNPSVAAGTPATIHITARDSSGGLAMSNQDQNISLQSLSGGEFSLSSSSWSSATSVTLPANTTSVDVYYKSQTAGTASLTFKAPFSSGDVHDIEITSAAYSSLTFTSGPTEVPVTEATQYSVGARDMYGNSVAAATDTPLYLYKTGAAGAFATDTAGSWDATSTTLPAGSDTAQFYYRDTGLHSNSQIIVSDQPTYDNPDTGITNAIKNITVIGQTSERLHIVSPAQTITAGNTSAAITVQMQKNDGTAAIQDTDQTVYISSDSNGSYSFTTSSSSSSNITSVTVPAGESQASVYYRDTLSGEHTLTFDSTTYGIGTTQVITVKPASPSKLRFSTPPQTVASNEPSEQIRIDATDNFSNSVALNQDTVIDLTSDCSSASYSLSKTSWMPITQLTIPSGQTSAFVYFKASSSSCTITAQGDNLQAASQAYKTFNGPSQLEISGAQTLLSGQTATYTVSLKDIMGNVVTTDSDIPVYISAVNGSTDAIMATIPAGSQNGTFHFTAGSSGSASVSVRDEASSSDPDTGLTNSTLPITVDEGTAVGFALRTTNTSAVVNQPQKVIIDLVNAYSRPVHASSTTTINLSTSGTGSFSTQATAGSPAITQTVLAAGDTSTAIYYNQTNTGTATVTAHNNSYTDGSTDITFTNGDLTSYTISGPQTLIAGQTGTYTIEGRDSYGNAVTLIPGQRIYLSSTVSDSVFTSPEYDATTHSIEVQSSATSASFTYKNTATGSDDITVSGEYPAAANSSITKAVQHLTITAGEPAKAMFVSPAPSFERGGSSDPITISLQNAYGVETKATTPLTLALSSSVPTGRFAATNAGPWDVNQVLIAAGESRSVTYYHDDSTTGGFTMYAKNAALTTSALSGEVTYGTPAAVTFTSAPQTITSTHTSKNITAALYNRYGVSTRAPIPTTLALASSSNTGEFSANQQDWGITSIVWQADASQSAFYYRDTDTGTASLRGTFGSLPSATQPVTVIPQVLDHFVVTNISTPQTAGTPSSVVVIAQDLENYTYTNFAGAIHFTSTDPEADLPDDYTFVSATDKGLHTFVNGVIFKTAGTHTVTATNVASSKSGSQDNIVVRLTGGAPAQGQTTVPNSPTAPSANSPVTSPAQSDSSSAAAPKQPAAAVAGTNGNETDSTVGASDTHSTFQNKDSNSSTEFSSEAPSAKSQNVLGSRFKALLESSAAPYVIPGVFYLLMLSLVLFVLYSMLREVRQTKILSALLEREKQTAADKTAFLGIASHHVRTPVAIIAGASELLAATAKDDPAKDKLGAVAEQLKQTANDIVQVVSRNTAVIGNATNNIRSAYRNPLFWAPLLIAIAVTVGINLLILGAGNQNPNAAAYAYQVFVLFCIASLLYTTIRGNILRRARRISTQEALLHEQELDLAKNDYINLVTKRFKDVIEELKKLREHFETTTPVMVRPLKSGVEQLENLVDKMQIVASIDTTTLTPQHFKLDTLIAESTELLTPQLTNKHQVLSTPAKSSSIALNQDESLMKRVLASILTNATEYSPENAHIAIDATQNDKDTIITVANTGSTVPEPFTGQLRPFMRDTSTDISDHQGLGMSLYLDSLIVRRFGGSLSISNKDNGTQVRIILPNK